MKKIKIITIAIILSILIPISSMAYNGDLDPKGYTTLPFGLYNGSGTIVVSSSLADGYKLYYQFNELNDTVYNDYKKTVEDSKKYQEEQKPILDNLKSIYEEKKAAYDAAKAEDPDSETTTNAYTALEEATKNYNDFISVYNTKIEEYNKQAVNLMPDYSESSWIETADKKVQVDLSKYSKNEEKGFILWSKIVTSDGTYYDAQVYTLNGTGSGEDEGNTNNNTNANTNSTNKNVDNTVAPSTLPKAGTSTIVIAMIIIAIVVLIVFINKYKFWKDIDKQIKK